MELFSGFRLASSALRWNGFQSRPTWVLWLPGLWGFLTLWNGVQRTYSESVRSHAGYYICTTIGRSSNTNINLIDEKNPSMGVTVRMSSGSRLTNCSLSVSVVCDSNGLQGPNSLDRLGTCEYSTVLRHPSGCAKIISRHGRGWGWFSTLLIILLCLFAGYLVGGAVYRYFHLGVRGLHVIPNLEVWLALPHRVQGLFRSVIRKFRRPTEGHRSSYSPVNF
ncbi:hypothetical protein AQUCO_00400440v1 [Aquilegia coerulea]|uniref:Autophagy-related protein 27 n=1 Tax=Aquilegia coerulea TaxID=218851 RepID=A0A2G5EUY3_AQUCA|nr:hypothetical protein AQUCO_00400440v1 [Aquilegia coerulea]